VRKRAGSRFGGAAASIRWDKQRRIVFAARHYLMRLAAVPPCRFDVISMEGGSIQWMRAAFDAG
jgi:putative endonuclease